MKKRFVVKIAIIFMIAAISFAGCKNTSPNTMTMTTAKRGDMWFRMAGTGEAVIDRGYENGLTSLDVTKNTALTFVDCANNRLTAEELNALFGTLHSNDIAGRTKTVYGNPGISGCNKSIAEGKGWTVSN